MHQTDPVTAVVMPREKGPYKGIVRPGKNEDLAMWLDRLGAPRAVVGAKILAGRMEALVADNGKHGCLMSRTEHESVSGKKPAITAVFIIYCGDWQGLEEAAMQPNENDS